MGISHGHNLNVTNWSVIALIAAFSLSQTLSAMRLIILQTTPICLDYIIWIMLINWVHIEFITLILGLPFDLIDYII